MRKFTGNKEIIKPAVTRFTTSFLSLQSLYKQKEALISMFSSKDWYECGSPKHKDAYEVRNWIIRDTSFWNHVAYCIKSVLPLVCVLREVDSEVRPAMEFIYELMDAAKDKIASNLGNVEAKYGLIWRRINNRWSPQLHQPLHTAGYYLNPQFRYEDNFKNTEHVKKGLEECMDRMLVGEAHVAAEIQLNLYKRKLGEKYGTQTPELMDFATRVLSLSCSASGCERNWSTFEMIHTKKRKRLEHKRMYALVYVKYNIALKDRTLKRNATMTDPIVVEEIEYDDEWITEIEDPVLSADPHWLEDNMEDLTLNDEAVRNVPIGTYQSTLIDREPPPRVHSPPRESTPPHEPTLSLGEPIVLYKRKSSEGACSSKRKAPRKSMRLDDITDDGIRINPYDDTNPLFEHHGDDSDEGDSDGGDSLGEDSLDGDLLIDEDDGFQR
ncbi:uncharacterized protein LOC133716316 [Rosa rugosa]|uniref:uncharacterized protein LOC133716316 n=1 Tax=Rosa rugosa TaxID=74645 RepID=UPI002B4101AF|nr:uncharacterized protein LOC133716316 [Rosa rugosa]